MNGDKQVAMFLERQHIKHVRHYYRTVAEINIELAKIHKNIEVDINKDKYKFASEYVNQYISYTTIWNMKFVYNLESPEVALLQIFHLDYIFKNEPESLFIKERRMLLEQKEQFFKLKPYKEEHIAIRKHKMLQFITEKENELSEK
ncbi:hypothetical protein [Lysinibacillus telephonicus]|uniref:hypothetical protein n=1 Tax=Lysinibacillus telephonicus TaxID=1714840 RepID=UPI003B9E50A6